MIRETTGGQRDIGDFFRNIWRLTEGGTRRYSWEDIRAALQATAGSDWERYYRAHIKGHEPLPIEKSFLLAGLRLDKDAEGLERVIPDLAASPQAKARWISLTGGKRRRRGLGSRDQELVDPLGPYSSMTRLEVNDVVIPQPLPAYGPVTTPSR
jgi:hypothetical protein